METPVNDDSDNGVGGNILSLLYRNNSYRIWLHMIRKWIYMAHSFVITETCNICIQLWYVPEQLLHISSTEAKP